jgi:hypothetical protein
MERDQAQAVTPAEFNHSERRPGCTGSGPASLIEEQPMSFSMSSSSIPAFETGLTALSGVLDKAAAFAEAKKIDQSVLLQSRLSPDMFPLVRQIQTAADLAKNGAARMADAEFPKFEDNETTIAALKERLAKTASYLRTIDAAKIDGAVDREISFPLGPKNQGHMNGADYLNHFLLPNFYFHLTAAYAILRHNGVEIGKQDFLGPIPLKVT